MSGMVAPALQALKQRRCALTGGGDASITEKTTRRRLHHEPPLKTHGTRALTSKPLDDLLQFDAPAASAHGHSALWRAAPQLPFFDGHFPGMPVLPGVIILEVSLAFLRRALAAPALQVRRALRCKFKGPVAPGETYRIRAERLANGLWQMTWALQVAAGEQPPTVEVDLEVSGL